MTPLVSMTQGWTSVNEALAAMFCSNTDIQQSLCWSMSASVLLTQYQGCNNRCTAAARRKESSPAAAALAADSPLNRSTCRVALDKSGP